jgi:small subunit ribosomal protein S1
LGIKDGKLSLSVKQAQQDPWDKVSKKYKVDQRVKGKVVKISDFGVFVALEPGLEGLVHITKIPPGKRLEKGQDVDVTIESIDKKEKKISLGLVLTQKPVGYK